MGINSTPNQHRSAIAISRQTHLVRNSDEISAGSEVEEELEEEKEEEEETILCNLAHVQTDTPSMCRLQSIGNLANYS